MLDQRLARRSVAGHDVHHTRWQFDLAANFGKGQRGQRRELRGLKNNRVSGGQRRRDLPRQHQQRKIPRNDLSHYAAGGVTRKLLLQKLCPSRVMIEVPRHQRNIDVTAFANRFSVVHGLKHGQPPRMLLHLPGERIQIPGAHMRRERLPLWRRVPGRSDGRINVRRRSLRDAGQLLAGRRIGSSEILASRRRQPRAVDEMTEAALVMIQPG